ncbi:MAG: glycerol-3-phosphate acyltransferase [Asgard group archaeon]|nr:glycerol-3-phosphate acyltransferase [Asgard group archaeon]
MPAIDILWIILACIGSYLIGSIPFSVWIGKLAKGADIREHQTRNPGGFNAVRTFGYAIGLPIMFLDFFKGTLTILVIDQVFSMKYFQAGDGSNFYHTFMSILGSTLCVLGHIYPIWLKFNGGQGMGVFMGVLFYLNPLIMTFYLLAFTVFVGALKLRPRVVGITVVIVCAFIALFLPLSPPWSTIRTDWLIGSIDFIYLLPSLILAAMDLALLVKHFQNLIFGSKVIQDKGLETS